MRDVASIIGLSVISSKEGRDLGAVNQVIVDLASGTLDGLIVGTGASERGIEAKDVGVIGVDAVMVETYKVARDLSELPKLLEKRREQGAGPREVLTSDGLRVGVLGKIYIDAAEKRVVHYEVSGGALQDMVEGVLELPPAEGVVDGRDSVVIASDTFGTRPATGGLRSQLARFGERAREQAKQAQESLEESTEQLRARASETAAKARDLGTEGAEQLRAKASETAARAKHALQDLGTDKATQDAEPPPAEEPDTAADDAKPCDAAADDAEPCDAAADDDANKQAD